MLLGKMLLKSMPVGSANCGRLRSSGVWSPLSVNWNGRLAADGDRLVTASGQGTLFFFDVANPLSDYRPVGFCNTPGRPRTVAWDHHLSRVVVGMDDGAVYAVAFPAPGSVDQTVSFEFAAQFARLEYSQRMKPKPMESVKVEKRRDEDEEEEDRRPTEEEDEEAEEEDSQT